MVNRPGACHAPLESLRCTYSVIRPVAGLLFRPRSLIIIEMFQKTPGYIIRNSVSKIILFGWDFFSFQRGFHSVFYLLILIFYSNMPMSRVMITLTGLTPWLC